MKENDRKQTPLMRSPTQNTTTYRKIKNPRKSQYRVGPGVFYNKSVVFKTHLFFFSTFQIKRVFFFPLFLFFSCFLRFRTRILSKSATFPTKTSICFLLQFIRVSDLKVFKTLILDAFAGENAVKPTLFAFCVSEGWGSFEVSNL